jgi:benzoyl-CoA reductase/2-hydroxyglutaryl-CoA dehydratase subunit BcrC/BadD/HgdB
MGRFLLLFLFVASLLLSACEQDNKDVKGIARNLNTIVMDKESNISSNPNDYIKNNQESYNNIVDKGNTSLEFLTKELKKSDQNGLKEWIMAKACTDILKNKNPVKEWASGKEWLSQYEDSK